jgi:ABC-type nitrate/sulfonate/bicarbonate transport system substrate-binding protein
MVARMVSVTVLIALLLAGVLPGVAQSPLARIVVSQGFINVIPLGFWVARERAFFRKYGVDVQIVNFRGSTQATQALIGGQVDMDMASAPQFFNAVAAGVDLVDFATLGPSMPYLLVARSGFHSPQELRGKRLGTAGQGITLAQLAEMIVLKHFGIDPLKDVTYMAIGPEPDRIAALEKGLIDATVFGAEFRPQIEGSGLQVMADLAQLNLPWEHDFMEANRSYLQSHHDVVVNFLKGLLEANAYVLNPQNKQFVMRIIAENLHLSTVAAAELSYTLARRLFIRQKPYPNVRGLEEMLAFMKTAAPDTAKLRVSTLVDDSILRSLDRSGWIDSLYKR